MKHLLLTTIAAVVLVGCGTTQQVTVQAPDISIHDAAAKGNIEAFKQHLAAGTDVNAKDEKGWAPLHFMAVAGNKEIAELLINSGAVVHANTDTGWTPLHLADKKEIAELLIAKGANINAKNDGGETPLDWAIKRKHTETADLLRKHGGKTGEELEVEGK
ncbi:ankyrin repeat domain-containing protein [Verrucomicrobia bacterium]|nr:ankyrin repeat domain-containing protein [Verrucomicrobiota bacterium]